jgi:hypothetical protein
MKPVNEIRAKSLFSAAVALSADDRAALLDRETEDDPSLRDEVEALLASHDEASAGRSKSEPAFAKSAG